MAKEYTLKSLNEMVNTVNKHGGSLDLSGLTSTYTPLGEGDYVEGKFYTPMGIFKEVYN